jgi:hypothetical protein
MSVDLDQPDERLYSLPPTTDALVVGPHTILQRNGLTLNDRSSLECYWVDEFNGFEPPAPRISSQENVQEDFALPDPAFYGERTMSLSGWVQAGSYIKALEMARTFMDTMIGLAELPMLITKAAGSVFTAPDVLINCRVADKPQLSIKIDASSKGVFKIPFSVSLVASTDGTYRSVVEHHRILVPTVVNALGRIYPRTYDLVYETPIDSGGHPISGGGGNSIVIHNDGNYKSYPRLRFNGGMTDITLINQVNNEKVIINGSIADSNYFELDISAGTIIDAAGAPVDEVFDTASDWLSLEGQTPTFSGDNSLIVSVASFDGTGSIEIFWHDRSL